MDSLACFKQESIGEYIIFYVLENMIVKVQVNKDIGKMYISSKPSHSRRDIDHSISYTGDLTSAIIEKMGIKNRKYFHAHKDQGNLILDDELPDQNW